MNLLLHRREELLAKGAIRKHLYTSNHADGTQSVSPRWGDLLFGASFRGHLHEMFLAKESNWGAILCIRTGSADFSRKVVMEFNRHGIYRQSGGDLVCIATGEIVPVTTEESYLSLAGMAYVEPVRRN